MNIGEGDCDDDSQCARDLYCAQRENFAPMNLDGLIIPTEIPHYNDMCIHPLAKVVARALAADPSETLYKGEGDCDSDDNCWGPLKCQ